MKQPKPTITFDRMEHFLGPCVSCIIPSISVEKQLKLDARENIWSVVGGDRPTPPCSIGVVRRVPAIPAHPAMWFERWKLNSH